MASSWPRRRRLERPSADDDQCREDIGCSECRPERAGFHFSSRSRRRSRFAISLRSLNSCAHRLPLHFGLKLLDSRGLPETVVAKAALYPAVPVNGHLWDETSAAEVVAKAALYPAVPVNGHLWDETSAAEVDK